MAAVHMKRLGWIGLRDSRGRPVVDDEVALGVQIATLRSLPVPWEPPMPDFDAGRVDARLVVEAGANRLRSLVPAFEAAELFGMTAELRRLLRVMDAFTRLVRVDAGGAVGVIVVDEAAVR